MNIRSVDDDLLGRLGHVEFDSEETDQNVE